MPTSLEIRMMDSRKTRTHVREILQNYEADTEFSVNEKNKIMTRGKEKLVTLKSWDKSVEKTRIVKQELEQLGLKVEFQN